MTSAKIRLFYPIHSCDFRNPTFCHLWSLTLLTFPKIHYIYSAFLSVSFPIHFRDRLTSSQVKLLFIAAFKQHSMFSSWLCCPLRLFMVQLKTIQRSTVVKLMACACSVKPFLLFFLCFTFLRRSTKRNGELAVIYNWRFICRKLNYNHFARKDWLPTVWGGKDPNITWNSDTYRFPPLRDGCTDFLSCFNDLLYFQNYNSPHLLLPKKRHSKGSHVIIEFKYSSFL